MLGRNYLSDEDEENTARGRMKSKFTDSEKEREYWHL